MGEDFSGCLSLKGGRISCYDHPSDSWLSMEFFMGLAEKISSALAILNPVELLIPFGLDPSLTFGVGIYV